MEQSDDFKEICSQLVHVTKLALADREDDLRLYVARIIRKLRNAQPDAAHQLEAALKARPPAPVATPFRRGSMSYSTDSGQALPADEESKLSLLKTFDPEAPLDAPLLSVRIRHAIDQLVEERRKTDLLADLGLQPSRSAIFFGQPGVGKTLTARWIAKQLGLPLFVLDLTAVMSSLLGRSGVNLRTALDYAKARPCVLLLDEIDAVAKRRSDDADVGELKRLVTVILQEVDAWPSSGLLLAATNHPELIDPALWRRFDLVMEFEAPSLSDVEGAVVRFLGPDSGRLKKWVRILAKLYYGDSYSDIERDINRLRRTLALGNLGANELIRLIVEDKREKMSHQSRIDLAVELVALKICSQHAASDLTGVSRDTIRKRTAEK